MKTQSGGKRLLCVIIISALAQLGLLGVISLSGCEQMTGAFRTGYEGAEYKGKLLPASDGLGARALDNWTKMDLDTQKFLETHRRPDYILYPSLLTMQFFYIKENLLVTFDRPAFGFRTRYTTSPIPEDKQRALLSRETK